MTRAAIVTGPESGRAKALGEVFIPMTGQHDVDPAEQDRPAVPLGRPAQTREARDAAGTSFVVDGGLLLVAAAANRG